MKKCTYCGMENSDDAQVCSACFTILPEVEAPRQTKKKGRFSFGKKQKSSAQATRTCPVCGTSNSASAVYCTACFSDLGDSSGTSGEAADTTGGETQTCPVCFTENSADSTVCCSCGADLTSGVGSKGGTGNGKKIAWIAAGVAAVALAAGGVALALNSISSPVSDSMEYMGSALTERLDQMTTVNEYLANSAALLESGEFAIEIDLDTQNADLSGTVFYDRGEKLLSGSVEWDDSAVGIETIVTFSADKKDVMFKLPESPDIYGCDLDEFGQTALAKLLPVDISSEMLGNLYAKPNTDLFSGGDIRKAWDALMKTVEYEETSASDDHPGCTVYQITWDAKAAKALLTNVQEQAESSFSLVDGANNLLSGLFGEVGTNAVNFFVEYMKQDCRLYINADGKIEALDFTVKSLLGLIGEEDVWTIQITNPDDPWESWTLTSRKGTASGYLVSNDDMAQLELDIDVLNILSLYVAGDYDDSSGAFSLAVRSGDLGMGLDGRVISRNGSAKIELSGDVIGMGHVELTCGLDNLETGEVPEMISDNGKYVDITDAKNWERMKVYLLD